MTRPLARWITDQERFARSVKVFAVGFLAGFLLGLAIARPSAHAEGEPRLELGLGPVHYETVDGVWWDSLFPSALQLNAPSLLLSVSVPGWRYSLVRLGGAHARATWGALEHDYAITHPAEANPASYRGEGSGDITGITVARTARAELCGLELGLEAGGFAYFGRWHETIYSLTGSAPIAADQAEHLNLTGFVGATARAGVIFLEARDYYALKAGFVNHHARQVVGGLSLAF